MRHCMEKLMLLHHSCTLMPCQPAGFPARWSMLLRASLVFHWVLAVLVRSRSDRTSTPMPSATSPNGRQALPKRKREMRRAMRAKSCNNNVNFSKFSRFLICLCQRESLEKFVCIELLCSQVGEVCATTQATRGQNSRKA